MVNIIERFTEANSLKQALGQFVNKFFQIKFEKFKFKLIKVEQLTLFDTFLNLISLPHSKVCMPKNLSQLIRFWKNFL